MHKALLIPLILLALISCVLLVGSQSTAMPTITSITQSGTLYHVFDVADTQLGAFSAAAMSQTHLVNEPLMRKETQVRIWFGKARLYFTHEGKVPQTAAGVTVHRTSRFTVRYVDEAVENMKPVPIGESYAKTSREWTFSRKDYETQLATVRRSVSGTSSRLTDEIDQPDQIHFIRVIKTKSSLSFNDSFYGVHAQQYSHCIIEITVDGYWSDDAAFRSFFQTLIEHAQSIARRAEIRAADCHRLFPPDPTPTPDEPLPTSGRTPTATPTPKTTEPTGKTWNSLSGTLLFNLKDPESRSANQRLILGIFDDRGELVGTRETRTDIQGRFLFQVEIREGDLLKLSAPLSYHTGDGEMVFGVFDDRISRDVPLAVECGGGEIRVKSDTRMDNLKLSLLEGRILASEKQPIDTINAVLFYGMMADGVAFYQDQLQVNLEYRLPVKLILFSKSRAAHPNGLAYYGSTEGDIHIYPETSDAYLGNFPGILYHELAHAVMYDIYDRNFPSGGTADLNHGGYANESSADSYLEGFADFMSAVVASVNEDNRNRAELEFNWIAWQNNGLSEEYAVAGTLLDLWDSGQSDDEPVSLDITQIWRMLRDYCPDFKSFYIRLQAAYGQTEMMAKINQIFISHGLYEVTDKLADGAGSYQPGEAFRDTNFNNTYDKGEFFVDFNADANGVRVMTYKPTYKPGWAAYPDNPTRNFSPVIPWHSIKTPDSHRYYEAKVTVPNHPELSYTFWPDNFGGMIYLPMPPEEYGAAITVSRRTPNGRYEGNQSTFTFTAAEFYKSSEQTMRSGFFKEHRFEAKSSAAMILLPVLGGLVIVAAAIWFLARGRNKREAQRKKPRLT